MVKVYIDDDERYPVFYLIEGEAPEYGFNSSIDISEEDLREHNRIEEEWKKHQLWLKKLFEESEKV